MLSCQCGHFLLLLLCGLAFDGGELLLGLAFDDGQHVILFHDEVLVAVQRALLTSICAEQDPVARFDVEGDALAADSGLPVARRDDGALQRLLFGGVGDDERPIGRSPSAKRRTMKASGM